jgi:hypothetical protein
MSNSHNKDSNSGAFEAVSMVDGSDQNAESAIDLVALTSILARKGGKKGRTGFVRPNDGSDIDLSDGERLFFDLISEGMTVSEASLRAGVSRHALYRRRNVDFQFDMHWDLALEVAADRLEVEADRRGMTGWEETIYYKGSAVGVRRRYSDRMLMFRLRALKPRRYARVRG